MFELQSIYWLFYAAHVFFVYFCRKTITLKASKLVITNARIHLRLWNVTVKTHKAKMTSLSLKLYKSCLLDKNALVNNKKIIQKFHVTKSCSYLPVFIVHPLLNQCNADILMYAVFKVTQICLIQFSNWPKMFSDVISWGFDVSLCNILFVWCILGQPFFPPNHRKYISQWEMCSWPAGRVTLFTLSSGSALLLQWQMRWNVFKFHMKRHNTTSCLVAEAYLITK